MAINPGLFTEWPWQRFGNLKYLVLAPWVLHGCHKMATTKELGETDMAYLGMLPLVLLRVLHSQVWLTISRLKDVCGDRRIVDHGIEFKQVDRESNWDDTFILAAILAYLGLLLMPPGQGMPLWRTDGALIMVVMHAGPVSFYITGSIVCCTIMPSTRATTHTTMLRSLLSQSVVIGVFEGLGTEGTNPVAWPVSSEKVFSS